MCSAPQNEIFCSRRLLRKMTFSLGMKSSYLKCFYFWNNIKVRNLSSINRRNFKLSLEKLRLPQNSLPQNVSFCYTNKYHPLKGPFFSCFFINSGLYIGYVFTRFHCMLYIGYVFTGIHCMLQGRELCVCRYILDLTPWCIMQSVSLLSLIDQFVI